MSKPINVLSVVEGDKFIRFFADSPVVVKAVQVPFYLTQECELALEQLIAQKLPYNWRTIYESHPVGFHNIRDISVADIAIRDYEMGLLKSLNRVEHAFKEVGK
ncbi:MAG: hypothetical protein ACK5PB_19280 [Pirellula sp.]|jgi:hypothetical protein